MPRPKAEIGISGPTLVRPQKSRWTRFQEHAVKEMYGWSQSRSNGQNQRLQDPVSIVCISDTHNTQPSIPDGDILIHAGDLSQYGLFDEIQAQLKWLDAQPHRHKIVIAGNHDLLLDPSFVTRFPDRELDKPGRTRSDLDWGGLTYLCNESAVLKLSHGREVKIYGSPWTPEYGNWAYQYLPIRDVWAGIVPEDVDVLVTHGPPFAHRDNGGSGCKHLLKEIWRVKPKLVVFGHIHAGYGKEKIAFDRVQGLYEDAQNGAASVATICLMIIALAGITMRRLLAPERQCKRTTTLVNAAMIGGFQNEERRDAALVEL